MTMGASDRARAEELFRERYEKQQREAIGRIVIGRACMSNLWTRDNALLASTLHRAIDRALPMKEGSAARAIVNAGRILGVRPDLELMLAATKREAA